MPDFSAPVPVMPPAPPPPPPPPEPFTAFVPLALLLGILIFSTIRDIVNLQHHLQTSRRQNAQSMERLKKVGQESELVTKLRDELAQLAPTDPASARVMSEFLPLSTATKKPPTDNSSQDKAPVEGN